MMKKLIFWIIIVVLVIVGAVVFLKKNSAPTPSVHNTIQAIFSDGTTTVNAVFDNTDDSVTFFLPALGQLTLPRAVSASGARYANADESIVFWNKGNDLTITKNGAEIFSGSTEENNIKLTEPTKDSVVKSPLSISGEAKGTWFFEASFPVQILDANGQVLGQTIARAKGDWMTTDFVPFDATIEFKNPTTTTGVLILKKDNPSGMSQNDNSVSIPVRFK
jgi:membrane-bound inhibitor of C-type lysozyme